VDDKAKKQADIAGLFLGLIGL